MDVEVGRPGRVVGMELAAVGTASPGAGAESRWPMGARPKKGNEVGRPR
jgi:hypothetical protein